MASSGVAGSKKAKGDRTYGQFCPIAAGLDVVGDRWVLLILRDLSFGDRRFTDLRRGLTGIAPNLLSDRLRALQDEGLVTTAELPPPAARTVYRLTKEGWDVVPLLHAMARFGVRYLHGEPSPGFDGRRAAGALLAPWRTPVEADLRVRLTIEGQDPLDLVLRGARTRFEAPEGDADVSIGSTVGALVAARRSGEPWVATVDGPAAARRAVEAAFAVTFRV